MTYVTVSEYYEDFDMINEDLAEKLADASGNVDILTHNTIHEIGFANLTSFQKGIVKDVVCRLADFYEENDDLVNNVLNSYSVNGVRMDFSTSANIAILNGVYIPKNLYRRLVSTGLCNRTL